MLLVLAPEGGERKLWVTRRLWLALYRQVSALAPEAQDDAAGATPPPAKPKPIPAQDTVEAEALSAVKISRKKDGAVLVFEAANGPLTLTFPHKGLASFRQMLESLADRAGWDAPAAMQRLGAESVAGAVVKRAST